MVECDREKEDPEAVVSKHSSKVETAVPRYTTLDGEISTLQSELGVLSQRQMQLGTMRPDERKIFERVKADLEQGVSGAQKALHSCSNFFGASVVQHRAAPEITRVQDVPDRRHWNS